MNKPTSLCEEHTAIYATTPASVPTLSSLPLFHTLEYVCPFCMDADLTSYRFTALVKRAGKPRYFWFHANVSVRTISPVEFLLFLSASEQIYLFFIFIPSSFFFFCTEDFFHASPSFVFASPRRWIAARFDRVPFFFFSFSFLRVLRFVERRIFHPSKSYPTAMKKTRLNYNIIGERERNR